MKGRHVILVDPTLEGPEELAQVAELAHRHATAPIVLCLSGFQRDYLTSSCSNPIIVDQTGPSPEERWGEIERALDALDRVRLDPAVEFHAQTQNHVPHLNLVTLVEDDFVEIGLILGIRQGLKRLERDGYAQLLAVGASEAFFMICAERTKAFGSTIQTIPVARKRRDSPDKNWPVMNKIGNIMRDATTFAASRRGRKPFLVVFRSRQTNPVFRNLAGDPRIRLASGSLLNLLKKGLPKPDADWPGADNPDHFHTILEQVWKSTGGTGNEETDSAVQAFLRLASKRIPGRLRDARQLLAALNVVRPDSITSYSWTGANHHIMARWCRHRGARFGSIEHGYTIERRPVDADVFYIWPVKEWDRWIDFDVGAAVRAHGNPLYALKNGAIRKSNDVPPPKDPDESFNVLVAPSAHIFTWDADYRFVSGMLATIDALPPAFQFSVRLHNSMAHRDHILAQFKARGAHVSENATETLLQAARRADALVTTVSTAALDGFSLNVPVVVANVNGQRNIFEEHGAGIHVATPADIAPALMRLRTDDEFRAETVAAQRRYFAYYEAYDPAGAIAEDLVREALTTSHAKPGVRTKEPAAEEALESPVGPAT